MIRKTGAREFTVYSESGKRLGSYPSRSQAGERLRQIEAAKAAKSGGAPVRGARAWSGKLEFPVPRGAVIAAPATAQAYTFSCGPAALRSALGALGLSVSEDELATAASTTEEGTSPEQLVAAAGKFGVAAIAVSGMRVANLEDQLAIGRPVLAAIQQEVRDPPNDGHWVLALGFGPAGSVRIMDPLDGSKYEIAVDVLAARWVVAIPPAILLRGVAVVVLERAIAVSAGGSTKSPTPGAELSVKFHEAKRHAVYKRDGYCCAYCGVRDATGSGRGLTIDHIVARNLGGEAQNGTTTPATNLVTACGSCNSAKQDSTPREWSRYARTIGPPPNAPPDWAKVRAAARKKIDIEEGARLAEKAREFREKNPDLARHPTREEMAEFNEEHQQKQATEKARSEESKKEREDAKEEEKKGKREAKPKRQGPGIHHDELGRFS